MVDPTLSLPGPRFGIHGFLLLSIQWIWIIPDLWHMALACEVCSTCDGHMGHYGSVWQVWVPQTGSVPPALTRVVRSVHLRWSRDGKDKGFHMSTRDHDHVSQTMFIHCCSTVTLCMQNVLKYSMHSPVMGNLDSEARIQWHMFHMA